MRDLFVKLVNLLKCLELVTKLLLVVVVVETNYSVKLKLKLNNWNLAHSLRMTFRNFHSILSPQGSQVFIQAHFGKNTDPIQTQFQSKYRPFTDPQA